MDDEESGEEEYDNYDDDEVEMGEVPVLSHKQVAANKVVIGVQQQRSLGKQVGQMTPNNNDYSSA